MRIAKEGFKFILLGLAAAGVGAYLAKAHGLPAAWALAALGGGFAAFCAFFFRDPERPLPRDPSRIYSPGDGRVISVAKEEFDAGVTVRIFLSIFDVHIQRIPYWGTVREVQDVQGAFHMAMRSGACENERKIVRIGLPNRGEEVVVEQIAGFVARRIRCWIEEGDEVAAGQRYGLIQFGSQAAVRLPAGVRPLVRQGDRVVGGVTPIGEWTASA